MCDVDGLLTTTRKDGNLEGHKSYYAKDHKPMKNLKEIVKELKPSVSHLELYILMICFHFYNYD